MTWQTKSRGGKNAQREKKQQCKQSSLCVSNLPKKREPAPYIYISGRFYYCGCAFKAATGFYYLMMTANGNKYKLKGSCLFHFDYGYYCLLWVLYAGPTGSADSIFCSLLCFWLYWTRKDGLLVDIRGLFCLWRSLFFLSLSLCSISLHLLTHF